VSAAPRVSVVLAVRDGAALLGPTLASVLAQEGVELELVAVDDGSTDATAEILAAHAARDPRLRLVRQEPLGLTTALARGAAAARAPLLARQDAGDLSLPGRLAAQVAALERREEVALVSCFTECVGPRGEPLALERGGAPAGAPFAIGGAPRAGPTAHGSALFRRAAYEAAGGYRAPFALAQDWDLWLRLGERGRGFVVGEALYRRRLGPESLSFRFLRLQRAFGEAARAAAALRARGESEAPALARAAALAREFEAARSAPPSRRAEALAHYHLGQLLRGRRDARARGYFRAALARDPLLARAWVRLAQCAALGSGA
jgi:glycosyltransferase involved in cell wall biosynthesis